MASIRPADLRAFLLPLLKRHARAPVELWYDRAANSKKAIVLMKYYERKTNRLDRRLFGSWRFCLECSARCDAVDESARLCDNVGATRSAATRAAAIVRRLPTEFLFTLRLVGKNAPIAEQRERVATRSVC